MRADVIVRWSASKPGAALEVYVNGAWLTTGRDLVDLAIERGERVFYCATGDMFTGEDQALAAWLVTDDPEPVAVRRRNRPPRYVARHRDEFEVVPAPSED